MKRKTSGAQDRCSTLGFSQRTTIFLMNPASCLPFADLGYFWRHVLQTSVEQILEEQGEFRTRVQGE